MAQSRYRYLTYDGKMQILPPVQISKRSTDKKSRYHPEQKRLDSISGEIYGDDTYGWLILMANPEYYMEYDIPRNAIIRIPFPLKDVEAEYHNKVLAKKDK